MIAWLGDWLRDIIAVVLLAVFVELLIPSKTMLRYIRLVIGLFILLTIMSPIMRMLQGDIQAKLDDGMRAWTEMSSSSEVSMPTLEQIQQRAQKLSEERDAEAFKMTERALAGAIQSELEQRMGAIVANVTAQLVWLSRDGNRVPAVDGIMVTLKGEEEAADRDSITGTEVEEVASVSISIEMDHPTSGNNAANGMQDKSVREIDENGQWEGADADVTKAIRSIIAQGWGVDVSRIAVRQPAKGQERH